MGGSVVTVRALAAVIQHELPPAMEEMIRDLQHVKLDLERSRMSGEDLLSRYMALNSRVDDASHEVRYASGQLLQHAWYGCGSTLSVQDRPCT